MSTNIHKRALPFLLCALQLACSEDAQVDPDLTSLQQPRTLEDGLFYASSSSEGGKAMTLDFANGVTVKKHELPGGTILTFPRPNTEGREVVVFTGGRAAFKDGDKRVPAEPAHVLVFSRAGEVLRQPLTGRYSALALSDDGKFAIAYGSSGNLVLQNAIEVINFDKAQAKDPSAATVMDLSFDGRAPTTFQFAPSTGFGSTDAIPDRRLALAPLANALQVIDLDHPEHGEISIKLSEQATLQPQKIVFAKDQFFVQSAGSAQILSFQNIEQPRGSHPFQLAPSILTAASPVSDLTAVGEGDALRLLALSNKLEVFDPRVGSTATVDAVSGFSQILQFSGSSPVDTQPAPRAALYGVGSAQVGFVDLGNETAWSTRNVEVIELGDPLRQLITLPGKTLVLATHASNRVSVIDLQKREVKKLLLDSTSATTLVDQRGTETKLWVGGSDGSLGSVNLDTFARVEVPLTFDFDSIGLGIEPDRTGVSTPFANARNLLLVPSGVDSKQPRLAVVQRSSYGRLTILDANNPQPDTALEVLGFFLADLFY